MGRLELWRRKSTIVLCFVNEGRVAHLDHGLIFIANDSIPCRTRIRGIGTVPEGRGGRVPLGVVRVVEQALRQRSTRAASSAALSADARKQ
jgi:hypothetical protein